MTDRVRMAQGSVEAAGNTQSLPHPDPETPTHQTGLRNPQAPAKAEPTRVLLIDDCEDDFILTREMMSQDSSSEFVLDWVCDYDGGETALLENRHDVYLVDYRLGARNGLDLLLKANELGCVPPIIMLTGQDDFEIANQSIQLGATDFLVKGQIVAPLLVRSIRYAIGRHQFRKQEAASQEMLKKKNKRLSELYATAHQFVDNVSHEFRTPLTVIKEFASILADGLAGELNEEQREFTGIILSRVHDLSLMVDDMLDISRLEAGLLGVRRREHHANEIADRVRSTLARKAAASGVTLEFEVDGALPTVYCDEENIGRVIINLVVNACKFCSEAGEVKLWARHDPEEANITFGITDNGPGIAPENVEAIFARFKQVGDGARASSQGVGLGLNIAKELVHINFGDIGVESELGKGSTFTFTVPTFEPVRILERFVKRVEDFGNGSSYASLVKLSVDDNTDTAACDKLEQFLERQMRGNDLIFRTQTQSWLLCAATNQQQLSEMIERIQTAREESNRSLPGDLLPDLQFDVNGTWSLAEDRAGFVAAFEIEWSAAGAKHVLSLMERQNDQTEPARDEARSA